MSNQTNNTNTTDIVSNQQQNILDLVENNGDTIHEACYMVFGISGWFKSYIQSDSFANISAEHRKKAFETYENLKSLLQLLDDNGFSDDNHHQAK